MIRIRRTPSWFPFLRRYEVELAPRGTGILERRISGNPIVFLQPILGVGDAWSFIDEADRQWVAGKRGWAVEFEEQTGS
jgi:hypothetical protein